MTSMSSSFTSPLSNTTKKAQISNTGNPSDHSDISSSFFRTTSSTIKSAIAKTEKKWGERDNINKLMAAFAFVLLFIFYDMNTYRQSLGVYRDHTTESIFSSEITAEEQRCMMLGRRKDTPFSMCDRETPFRYSVNPATDRSNQQRPQNAFRHDWPKRNKILLLRNDGKFGNFGNQMNSLLHAFDYARDHNLHLGILFHSWAMDVIQSMFYETGDFEALGDEMMKDFGILVVRNQTQLALYDEVVSQNAEQLYFYKSSNKHMDHWRETMEGELFLLSKGKIVIFGLAIMPLIIVRIPLKPNLSHMLRRSSSQVDNPAVILPIQSRLRLRPQRIEGAGRVRDARSAVQGARGRCEVLG